jgi:hypothetical protein
VTRNPDALEVALPIRNGRIEHGAKQIVVSAFGIKIPNAGFDRCFDFSVLQCLRN